MMGRSRLVAAFFNPLFMMIYPVPKAALMPIIMLWLGVGDVVQDAGDLPRRVAAGRLSQLPGRTRRRGEDAVVGGRDGALAARRLARVVLPAALPEIMVGCRTGLVLALITMVTSEMIARQTGSRQHLLQRARHGAIQHRLRHDRDHRRARLRVRWAFEAVRREAGRLGRAGARDRGGVGMTAAVWRRNADDAVAGIAADRWLHAGAVVRAVRPGSRLSSLLPPPVAVFARLIQRSSATARF